MRHRLVQGTGPRRPAFILVGEAPGREEERAGRPFVGRAGRFLRASLTSVGVDVARCFFTNVMRFRPARAGRTRPPSADEVNRSLPALRRELAARPRVPAALLGRTAAAAVLGRAAVRGAIVRKEDRLWLVTHHPAAAMRFPSMRRAFMRDLRRFVRALKGRA